ncbi:hypothetical protein D3C86_1402250 [compost metagenome]
MQHADLDRVISCKRAVEGGGGQDRAKQRGTKRLAEHHRKNPSPCWPLVEAQRHLRPLLGGTIDLADAKPYTSIDVGGVAKDAGKEIWEKARLKHPPAFMFDRPAYSTSSSPLRRGSIGAPIVDPRVKPEVDAEWA